MHWKPWASSQRARSLPISLAQARGELGPGSGQGTEYSAVGMGSEERLDARAIFPELRREHLELPAPGDGVKALGRHERGVGFPLAGIFKSGDARLHRSAGGKAGGCGGTFACIFGG